MPPAVPQHIDLAGPRAQVLLAIADDALITGHRASHWTGVAPSIEEDLAFSTLAQDGISQADLWYQVLLGHDTTPDAVDALGLGRAPDDYRHAIVFERPPRDFGYTLTRQWVTVHLDAVRLDALSASADGDVAALADRLLHELRYHREHAEHWFGRLAGGGDPSHGRLRAALADVLPESLGAFEPVEGEPEAVEDGLFPVGHEGLRERYLDAVAPPLERAGLGELVPTSGAVTPPDASGGRTGHHSPDFTDDVWPEMTALHRAHPGARW